MIEIDSESTTSQHPRDNGWSFKRLPRSVKIISAKSPNPTKSAALKNLFLKGFVLKQLPFVRAVNI